MNFDSRFNKRAPSWSHVGKNSDRLWLLPTKPQNVYLAASMNDQASAARFALQLIDAGFNVTSTWLRKDFSDKSSADNWCKFAEYEAAWGSTDLADLERSDTLVVLATERSSSGGYWVELGYFLGAKRENIVFVGDRQNVFAFTDTIRYCSSMVGLVEWLCDSSHGYVVPTPNVGVLTPPQVDEKLSEIHACLFNDKPSQEENVVPLADEELFF